MSKQANEIPGYTQVNIPTYVQAPVSSQPNDVWWQRWLIYGASTVFGVIAIICGIFTMIGFNLENAFAGIILMY